MFSFSPDAPAKSCGTYVRGFPDLKHPDLQLLGVLLSMCTLQQGIQLQSPKAVGEHKRRWSLHDVANAHIPTCTWHLAGAVCSVCMQGMNFWSCCWGRGVCWGPWERRLQDTNCQNNSSRPQLPPWGKPVGHREEAPGLDECFSGLDLACWTHAKHIGTTHYYNSVLQKQILLEEGTVRKQNLQDSCESI